MNKFILNIKNLISFIIFNKKFHILLKFLIFIISIYFVYSKINLNTISVDYKNLDISYLVLIFILQTSGAYLILVRWRKLLEASSDQKYSNKQLVSTVIYSNISYEFSFISYFLTRLVFATKKNIKLNQLFSSIIAEKILSIYSILLIFMFAYISLYIFYDNQILVYINYVFIFVFLFLIFSLILFLIINFYYGKISLILKNIILIKYFIGYLDYKKIITPFLHTFFLQLFSFLIILSVPLFLNINVNLFLFLIFIPIVTFISALPISITQWGYRETVFIFFYGLIGIDSNSVFLISITYGILGSLIFILHAVIYETFNFLKIR